MMSFWFLSFTARLPRAKGRFCGHTPPEPRAWGGRTIWWRSEDHEPIINFDSDRPSGALDPGSRVARVVSAELAAGRPRRRCHSRGLPTACRVGRRLARQPAARGGTLRVHVRRVWVLAVLQFAAHH